MTQLSARFRQRRLEPHRLAFTQFDASLGNFSDTDPWSLQILDDRDRRPPLLRSLPNGFDGGGVRGVGAVGKVQPGGIHALFEQSD